VAANLTILATARHEFPFLNTFTAKSWILGRASVFKGGVEACEHRINVSCRKHNRFKRQEMLVIPAVAFER
jgi:hypothetical protein